MSTLSDFADSERETCLPIRLKNSTVQNLKIKKGDEYIMTNILLQDEVSIGYIKCSLFYNEETKHWNIDNDTMSYVHSTINDVLFPFNNDSESTSFLPVTSFPVYGLILSEFNYEATPHSILETECNIYNLTQEFIEGNPLSIEVEKFLDKEYDYDKHEGVHVSAIYKCKNKK